MSKIKKLENKLKYYQIEYWIASLVAIPLTVILTFLYLKKSSWFWEILIISTLVFLIIEIVLYFLLLQE